MTWRRVLLSRFVIVPALIAATVAAWNAYVEFHAHGMLSGRVIDASGKPIADATVVLWAHDFVTQIETARTKTDAVGDFHFDNNASHLIQLQASAGKDVSPRVTIRLWFRAQDRVVAEPLKVVPAG